MKYFQLMSGDASRDFSRVMFDFGVAIVGPGDHGPVPEKKDFYIEIGQWSKFSWLYEAAPGDRVVMHSGQSYVQAVGEIVEKEGSVYQYSNCFEDIDGWDLQHFCYMSWRKVEIKLDGKTLSRATVQRLHDNSVISKIDEAWETADRILPQYSLKDPGSEQFSYEILENELISSGLRIEDAENTLQTLLRVEKLSKWYLSKGSRFPSSEHEIRSFLVIPVLYALGWSYQRMAVEFNHLDIALFPDSNRDFPEIIIETKSMWTGSVYGINQVKRYLDEKRKLLKKVKSIIITDGLTYWLYKIDNLEVPYAYMSLRTKRMTNPAFPQVKGMVDFIKSIIP